MSTLTVGLDGSPQSLAAADWAAREAEQREASLRLVHAWEPQPGTWAPLVGAFTPVAVDAQREWADYMLREARSRLAESHPALTITTLQVAGPPAAVLLSAAADDDLLVLGSRGLSGVAGFLVGSVAHAAVAGSERPVVLVRAGADAADEHLPDATGAASTGTPSRDVVLGLDPENPGEAVLGFAFEAAQRRAADLRVVHGWTPPSPHGYGAAFDAGPDAEPSERVRQRLAEVLRPWKDKFPGVRVREQAVVGSAGRHLVHASRDATLVVVGRRNRRAHLGGHVGPVTHAVLQHAATPVAVVPHD
ncbi:universal stress protein [Streptomyces pseudovenezuelae]|uniref:universal stress protein n=1 Tax=Streptomyces pseudovenezuelae TaxID=67350 RepID=UPI002E3213A9|nr:universal stress protein [Streptomyces pseudovenezuelae]